MIMNKPTVPIHNIADLKILVRGQKVLLDFHLAKLYAVETRALK